MESFHRLKLQRRFKKLWRSGDAESLWKNLCGGYFFSFRLQQLQCQKLTEEKERAVAENVRALAEKEKENERALAEKEKENEKEEMSN